MEILVGGLVAGLQLMRKRIVSWKLEHSLSIMSEEHLDKFDGLQADDNSTNCENDSKTDYVDKDCESDKFDYSKFFFQV